MQVHGADPPAAGRGSKGPGVWAAESWFCVTLGSSCGMSRGSRRDVCMEGGVPGGGWSEPTITVSWEPVTAHCQVELGAIFKNTCSMRLSGFGSRSGGLRASP